MPKLSVIIPTHRRAKILGLCLGHLERQTIASDMEVIVVSDGHDDETSRLFETTHYPLPTTHFLEVPKSQQGVARNEGLKHAAGEYVLFIGDDIFLEPGACEKHLEAHKRFRFQVSSFKFEPETCKPANLQTFAVLGFTTWDPAASITPVMRWLEDSGWQFGYPMIAPYAGKILPEEIQHRFTYTSHISLPLEVAKKFPFRTDIRLYGWEDIEWGMRLRDAGIKLFYEPDAKALHHHHVTLEDSLRRMKTLGTSAKEIQAKVPEFDRVPKGWKLFLYRIAALLPIMAGKHRKAFLTGLRS